MVTTESSRSAGRLTTRGPVSDWGAAAVAIAIAAFLLATNYWTGGASHTNPWGTDQISYQEMSAAAPHLPHIMIGSAYTQRFVPHYIVGLVNWITGVGLHPAYRIVWAVCFVALVAVFARTLLVLRLGAPLFALSFALFLFDPYSLRESILTPGAVQDLTFVLGVAILMYGLLARRFSWVLAGTAVAILSRQTALLIAPVAAFWVISGPWWRTQPSRSRKARAATLILMTVLIYAGQDLLTSSFTKRFEPSFPGDTVLPLLIPTHHHLSVLLSHVGRCIVPLIMPAAVLMATLIVTKLRNRNAGKLPFEFYGCLAIAAAVMIQPLGVSPTFPGFAHNEQRLMGIGLLPLVLAAAVALRYAQVNGRLSLGRQRLAIAIAFLAVGSLHHIYTVIGPPNLKDFVALEFVAAGIVGAVILTPLLSYLRPGAVRPS